MDLALVGIALRMALKRPFSLRERRGEALGIGCGAAYVNLSPALSAFMQLTKPSAFIAGLVKLSKFASLSGGDLSR